MCSATDGKRKLNEDASAQFYFPVFNHLSSAGAEVTLTFLIDPFVRGGIFSFYEMKVTL